MEKGPNGRNSRDIRICEYRQLTHLLTFTNILCFRVRKKVKRKASESLLFGSLRHWWRTYVPFAQWSPEALGAGFILPFALTNSSRFLLRRTAHRADASLVCPPRSWGHRTEPYSISPSKKDHSFRKALLLGGISRTRTYVPFAQWSPEALGAGFFLPFALTNSSRFLLRRTAHRADASLVCPPRSWGHRTEPYSISPSKKDHSFRKALLLGGISRTRTYDPHDVNVVL